MLFPGSTLGLGDNEDNLQISLIPAVPHPCNGQHSRFCPTWDVFQLYQWRTASIKLSCIFLQCPLVEMPCTQVGKANPNTNQLWGETRSAENQIKTN